MPAHRSACHSLNGPCQAKHLFSEQVFYATVSARRCDSYLRAVACLRRSGFAQAGASARKCVACPKFFKSIPPPYHTRNLAFNPSVVDPLQGGDIRIVSKGASWKIRMRFILTSSRIASNVMTTTRREACSGKRRWKAIFRFSLSRSVMIS